MKKKVLIVEDDEAIRESLIELLDTEGYTTQSAVNGQDALDQLGQATELPDLILLDLMMPVKDGFQFCLEKIQNARIAEVPVVIMSADSQIQAKQAKTQARGYLTKPVDIEHVLAVVKQYCD